MQKGNKENINILVEWYVKVQVDNDREKAQSEKDSDSKNEVGKNLIKNQVLIP